MNKQTNKCVCCGKEFYSTTHMWWCDDCRRARKEMRQKGEVLVCKPERM